jgi:hypothetical protein
MVVVIPMAIAIGDSFYHEECGDGGARGSVPKASRTGFLQNVMALPTRVATKPRRTIALPTRTVNRARNT